MKILFKHLMRFRIALVILMLLVNIAGFTIAASAQSTTESDFITILDTQRTALNENALAINSSLSTSPNGGSGSHLT